MANVLTAIAARESNVKSLKKSRSLQSEMIFAHVRDWFDSNMREVDAELVEESTWGILHSCENQQN